MSLRKGARAVLAISNVRDKDGAAVTIGDAPDWEDTDTYDIDDLVTVGASQLMASSTIQQGVYKCINPSTATSGDDFDDVAANFKQVPVNPVLPLISYNFNDSGGTTTQLFQDESDTARTITNTSAATCTVSFAEVQGSSNATLVQDALRRGYTFSCTIYKHGFPAQTGDLTITFAGQVQDRTDQSGDAFTQVDVTIGVEGSIRHTRVA